jgi:SpoU rRNA methylase family enzyme
LKQALDHFAAADAALKAGNLALYQSEVNAAQAAIAKANQLAAKAGGTSPSPSPTMTPGSPTPSPSG